MMKTILTLIILAFSVCSFGQTVDLSANNATIATAGTESAINKDKTPVKALTAADSIVLPIAKFEPSVKTDLENFDAEITKLGKQYEDIIKAKNQTLKTFYGIYCNQNKIDQSKASVKLGKDGLII